MKHGYRAIGCFLALTPAVAAVAQEASPAQATTFEGELRAKGSGAPVKDALVIQSDDRENSARTDAQGRFSLKLPAGAKGIILRGRGFEDLEMTLDNGVPAEKGPYYLEPAPELMRLGVVRARRKTEVSQQSLQREEMERIPGTGGDAVRSLQTLPSVLAAGNGSADITVRGGAPGDNVYYVDRLAVPFVFHLGGFGSVVPTRMLEGIDLFPGGFSSLYGDAIGGVVQLRTENRTPERTSGQVEVGLLQSSAYLEGHVFGDKPAPDAPPSEAPTGGNAAPAQPTDPSSTAGTAPGSASGSTTENVTVAPQKIDGRVGYRAGFRRTYVELYSGVLKKFIDEEKLSLTTLPQATDYQFLLNGNHSSGTWQAYLLGAGDRVGLATSTSFSDNEDGRSSFRSFTYFETTGIRYNSNLGDGWGLTLVPQQTYFLLDANFFGNKVKVTTNSFLFEAALDKRFNAEWSATLGVRPTYTRTQTDIDAIQIPTGGADVFFDPITAPRSTEKDTRGDVTGNVYLDTIWKPVRPLTLNPSVLVMRGRRESQFAVDPRFSTRYTLGDLLENEHALKGAVGVYSQMPDPAFDSDDYGNPDLKLERANHVVLGWETKWGRALETDVQVYHKDMYDLVGTNTKQPEKKYDNNVKGRSKGAELLIKRPRNGRFAGWISYGISRSERRDPLNGQWYLFDYDRTHSVNIVASYKITGAWELGTKWQFQSGAPTTTVPGGTFNQATGRYVSAAQTGAGTLKANDERLPAFFQIDVRSDYDFLFDTWKLDLYTEIQNVTNRQNVVAQRYNPDYSKRENVTGAPIIPSVGVIASF